MSRGLDNQKVTGNFTERSINRVVTQNPTAVGLGMNGKRFVGMSGSRERCSKNSTGEIDMTQ